MENKIDQFFKDKLESHLLPPSEEAWAKVEANLSKKNNAIVWRIAAAILITGALVSIIIWSQQGSEKNQQVITENKSQKNNQIKEKSKPQISSVEKTNEIKSSPSKSPMVTSLPRSVSPHAENKSDRKEKIETEMWSVKTQTTAMSVSIVEKNKSSFAKTSEDKENIKQEATQPATIASTKQKPIKLEFTLEDFSPEQPVATVTEEKSTGLKKVWELAREVKNGEGPVHEMKNELFAFNFRKNKVQ